jgi:hypothetical protein
MEIDGWSPVYDPSDSDWRDGVVDGVGVGGDIAVEVPATRSPYVVPSPSAIWPAQDRLVCANDVRRVMFLRHLLGVSSLSNVFG